MMPGLLTKLGLFEAVDELFEKIGDSEDVIVEKEIPVDVQRLPENKEIMLYRVIQEMLNNTLKHAKATKIEIRMEVDTGTLRLSYSDNGIGFNVEDVIRSKTLGLQSIKSRVDFLNGKHSIDSGPGKGTSFSIEIPV
jgi:signal transduction histidine kinase